MDDIERLYEHQTMMAVSIYSFLDNLLSALRTRPPSPPAPSIQMQPGGYAEDMFLFMSDKEKDELQCSICYSILKDAHQCQNAHLFCYSCVYVWSHTPGGGHDRCPMCRADGLYAKNSEVNDRLAKKRVKCTKDGCNWRGCLRDFDEHEHRRYQPSEISAGIELPSIASATSFKAGISTSDFLRQLSASSDANAAAPESTQPAAAPTPNPPAPAASRAPVGAVRRPNGLESGTGGAPVRRGVRRPDPLVRRDANGGPAAARRDANGGQTAGRRESNAGSTATRRETNGGPTAARRDSNGGPTAARRDSNGGPTAARRESNGIAARPGMIPRPPTTPRPPNSRPVRTGTNTVSRRAAPPSRQPPASVAPAARDSPESSTAAPEPTPVEHEDPISPAAAPGEDQPSESDSGPSNHTDATTSSSTTTAPSDEAAAADGLQYRRLANPGPRTNSMTSRLSQGRDQLFILMTLMSYELEERRRAIEQFQSMTAERERVRLQQLSEVQTLNRRLTLVTNNLSRLLDARAIPSQSPRAIVPGRPLGLGGRASLEDTSSDDSSGDDLFP